MPKFEIKHKKNDIYKQFISFEMLKNKILAKNVIYLSVSHSNKQINYYLKKLKEIFIKIGRDISGKNRKKILDNLFKNKKEISLKRLN